LGTQPPPRAEPVPAFLLCARRAQWIVRQMVRREQTFCAPSASSLLCKTAPCRAETVPASFVRARRAQWIVRETVRREQTFCAPNASSLYGDAGSFFAQTDAAGVTAPPHTPRRWTSAQDQKVMSDVLASSCCGRPVYRKLIPFNYQVWPPAGIHSTH